MQGQVHSPVGVNTDWQELPRLSQTPEKVKAQTTLTRKLSLHPEETHEAFSSVFP